MYRIAIALLVCLCCSRTALALQSFIITDTSIVWPGYSTTIGDVNGVPDITSLVVNMDNQRLASLAVNYTHPQYNNSAYNAAWNNLGLGDFFIDAGSDGKWDYVLRNPDLLDNGAATWNVLRAAQGIDVLPADWKDTYTASFAIGGLPRKDHPIALKDATGLDLLGTAAFDGWDLKNSLVNKAGQSVWTLATGTDILLTGPVTFGFTMTCANDVIFGQVDLPGGGLTNGDEPLPTPEPATLLLSGLGLGALGLRRRATARQGRAMA